jgi:beta-galactosidase/beta-glucuronidase
MNRQSVPVQWDAMGGTAALEIRLGKFGHVWDEFHPVLQYITIKLKGDSANEKSADDSRQITFGMREIKTHEKDFVLNGQVINLRGTHSGGDFPLTGYPATDVATWKKIIQTCKDFGLNHMRFHSWCPPDAAFTAADELGR